MASNYNMSQLAFGQALALAAFLMTALFQTSSVARIPSFALASAYSIMMFASSYVEEEHHFWYWATSAWLLYLGATREQRYAAVSFISSSPRLYLPTLTDWHWIQSTLTPCAGRAVCSSHRRYAAHPWLESDRAKTCWQA